MDGMQYRVAILQAVELTSSLNWDAPSKRTPEELIKAAHEAIEEQVPDEMVRRALIEDLGDEGRLELEEFHPKILVGIKRITSAGRLFLASYEPPTKT